MKSFRTVLSWRLNFLNRLQQRGWLGFGLPGFHRRFRGVHMFWQAKIAAATFADLNVHTMHQRQLRVPGHLHMASAADLIADDRDALFAPHPQPVVMAEDWHRDAGAQFGKQPFGSRPRGRAGFEGLEFQKIFDDIFHKRMKLEFIPKYYTPWQRFLLNIFCHVFSMLFSRLSARRVGEPIVFQKSPACCSLWP
jgi:hypothetical protein